jgi:hypothetical protein
MYKCPSFLSISREMKREEIREEVRRRIVTLWEMERSTLKKVLGSLFPMDFLLHCVFFFLSLFVHKVFVSNYESKLCYLEYVLSITLLL